MSPITETIKSASALKLNYLASFDKPEIINTDQGSQFTAEEFVDTVLGNGCKLSMDGRGAWRDNVMVERLWRTVKYEHVYLNAYDSVRQAKEALSHYLGWYNSERLHSSLGKQTPDEAYAQWYLLGLVA